MPDNKHAFNPKAEVSEAALKKAAEEWGNKPVSQMREERTRLTNDLKQIAEFAVDGKDAIDCPLLGGEGTTVAERSEALDHRNATRHFLTEAITKAEAQERQLKQMMGNLSPEEQDKGVDAHLQQNLDPLGYERDRGVGHGLGSPLEPDIFGGVLAHLDFEGDKALQRFYQEEESPLATALKQGIRSQVPLSNRVELQHATVTTAAGVTAERAPDRRRVEKPTRPPELLDVIPREMESTAMYTYILETTRSGADGDADAAAVKNEGAASTNEATFIDSREEVKIPNIEVNVPVTFESLNNTQRTRRVINEKLPRMIDQVIDKRAITALLALTGIGSITAAATGNAGSRVITNLADQVLKAQIEQVFARGRTEVDFGLMFPQTYTGFVTEKSASGGYLIRSSEDLNAVRSAWGIPVGLATFGLDYGTAGDNVAVFGDFGNYSVLAYAEQSFMRLLDQHGTEALELTYRFQAWWRAIVVYLRALAFCVIKSG